MPDDHRTYWGKLGILTGFLGAIAALLGILYQIGVFDRGKSEVPQIPQKPSSYRPIPPPEPSISEADLSKLIGTWRGKFALLWLPMISMYNFTAEGSVVELSTDQFTRKIRKRTGSYTYVDGQVNIRWLSGAEERALLTWLGSDTFRYRIVQLNQQKLIGIEKQIGLEIIYRRVYR